MIQDALRRDVLRNTLDQFKEAFTGGFKTPYGVTFSGTENIVYVQLDDGVSRRPTA